MNFVKLIFPVVESFWCSCWGWFPLFISSSQASGGLPLGQCYPWIGERLCWSPISQFNFYSLPLDVCVVWNSLSQLNLLCCLTFNQGLEAQKFPFPSLLRGLSFPDHQEGGWPFLRLASYALSLVWSIILPSEDLVRCCIEAPWARKTAVLCWWICMLLREFFEVCPDPTLIVLN